MSSAQPSRAPAPERPASDSAADAEPLPLRLSVGRAGLSIELTSPVAYGMVRVDELELGLPGLSYPVDLSGGVKRFRNRRGILERMVVSLDLAALAHAWQAIGCDVLGAARATVRVRTAPGLGPHAREAPQRGVVSVCVHHDDRCLAFDLVLTLGARPRFVIDRARAVGLDEGPLALALRFLDAGLSQVERDAYGIARSGRVLELSAVARAVAWELLPGLGCRVPEIPTELGLQMEVDRGGLRLVMDSQREPTSGTARSVRLASAAELNRQPDDELSVGNVEQARAGYLDSLDKAPSQAETLLALAEIDGFHGQRAESALSFTQELGKLHSSERSLLEAKVLEKGRRQELGLDALRSAFEVEDEPTLASLIALHVAQLGPEWERDTWLNQAVGRAPYLAAPRWARFTRALERGDAQKAQVEAEHLEGLVSNREDRSQIVAEVGRGFLGAGFEAAARRWLMRALRHRPDDPRLQLSLADLFTKTGDIIRAAELYQAALGKESEIGLEPEVLDGARCDLADLLAGHFDEISLALGYLSAVDMRSRHGLRARASEIELFERLGDDAQRRRVETRVLDAVELGWLDDAWDQSGADGPVKNFSPSATVALGATQSALAGSPEEPRPMAFEAEVVHQTSRKHPNGAHKAKIQEVLQQIVMRNRNDESELASFAERLLASRRGR